MYTMAFVPMWIAAHFIFTLAHEFGHVIMSRILFADKNWSIELGMGKPLVRIKRLTINYYFFMYGYANFTQHDAARWRHILRLAGGFIVNILCIILIFPLHTLVVPLFPTYSPLLPHLNDFFGVIFFYNLLMIFATAIPFKYPWDGSYSDGYKILWLMRKSDRDMN